jgi:hypothetical protein
VLLHDTLLPSLGEFGKGRLRPRLIVLRIHFFQPPIKFALCQPLGRVLLHISYRLLPADAPHLSITVDDVFTPTRDPAPLYCRELALLISSPGHRFSDLPIDCNALGRDCTRGPYWTRVCMHPLDRCVKDVCQFLFG